MTEVQTRVPANANASVAKAWLRGLERSNQHAHWALGQGLTKGDVVCLLMTNRLNTWQYHLGS